METATQTLTPVATNTPEDLARDLRAWLGSFPAGDKLADDPRIGLFPMTPRLRQRARKTLHEGEAARWGVLPPAVGHEPDDVVDQFPFTVLVRDREGRASGIARRRLNPRSTQPWTYSRDFAPATELLGIEHVGPGDAVLVVTDPVAALLICANELKTESGKKLKAVACFGPDMTGAQADTLANIVGPTGEIILATDSAPDTSVARLVAAGAMPGVPLWRGGKQRPGYLLAALAEDDGMDRLRVATAEADSYLDHHARTLVHECRKDRLPSAQWFERAAQTFAAIDNPDHRSRFRSVLAQLAEHRTGLALSAFDASFEEARSHERRASLVRSMRRRAGEISELATSEDVETFDAELARLARRPLTKREHLDDVSLAAHDWRTELQNTPPIMATGQLELDAQGLRLPAAAVTAITGPAASGRTALLLAIASFSLSARVQRYQEGRVLLFAYGPGPGELMTRLSVRESNCVVKDTSPYENLDRALSASKAILDPQPTKFNEKLARGVSTWRDHLHEGRLVLPRHRRTLDALCQEIEDKAARAPTVACFIDDADLAHHDGTEVAIALTETAAASRLPIVVTTSPDSPLAHRAKRTLTIEPEDDGIHAWIRANSGQAARHVFAREVGRFKHVKDA